eukprot:3559057-Amphidinium_carterae.1
MGEDPGVTQQRQRTLFVRFGSLHKTGHKEVSVRAFDCLLKHEAWVGCGPIDYTTVPTIIITSGLVFGIGIQSTLTLRQKLSIH